MSTYRRNAKYNAPLNDNGLIGAKSADELWNKNAEGSKAGCSHAFFSFAGTRGDVTWRDIAFAGVMEMLRAMLITIGVGLGSWYQGSDAAVNAIILGAFYAISYYVATRLPSGDKLQAHGNGALTFAYLFTRDIGLWGFLLYTVAQYIGCMLAGAAILSTLLQGLQGGAALGVVTTATHSLIPVPVTTGPFASSLTTVVLLELCLGTIFALVIILKENLNTDLKDQMNDNGRNAKNHSKATKLGAFAIFWLVLFGYQFGVFTFNNVAWLGPAFGGVRGVLPTDWTRQLNNQVDLYDTIYTDSVFGTTGAAMALYVLMPYAAGLIAAGLAWLICLAGFESGGPKGYRDNGPDMAYMHAPVQSASAAGSPTTVASTVTLRSPLLNTGT